MQTYLYRSLCRTAPTSWDPNPGTWTVNMEIYSDSEETPEIILGLPWVGMQPEQFEHRIVRFTMDVIT